MYKAVLAKAEKYMFQNKVLGRVRFVLSGSGVACAKARIRRCRDLPAARDIVPGASLALAAIRFLQTLEGWRHVVQPWPTDQPPSAPSQRDGNTCRRVAWERISRAVQDEPQPWP